MSITDRLTDVYNRNKLEEIANATGGAQNVQDDTETVLLMLDIDYFKSVNDTYGHEAGDRVLVAVTDQIKACVRSADIVVRWGGEEFVVLLIGTELNDGRQIAEKIRKAVEKAKNDVCPVTISGGISAYRGGNYHDAIKRADIALYYAKENGRNRIICYDDISGLTQASQ